MDMKKNGRSSRRTAVITTIHVLALCTLGAAAYVTPRQGSAVPAVTPAPQAALASGDLEQAFWACDYVATTYGVQAAPVAFCSDVTEALQAQKFGGDFEQMLQWWRDHKPAAHSVLSAHAR